MDDTLLRERLRESEQRNEALSREVASLRASLDHVLQEFAAFRRDYEALVDATRIITAERDALRQRVAELEAANNRLVDMLWGRRSERRSESPDQRHLDFGDEPVEPPSAEEQEIITAQAQADEAMDRELLRRLEARRKARREQAATSRGVSAAPSNVASGFIDLPEEQKQGLKPIGVKTTERLRFEKPHMYVEVIKRPQYVVPGQPEEGVRSMPPPLSIVEGCKYDFSVVAAMAATEVRLPRADLSAAGLVRPVRLVPQPLHGERSDELRAWTRSAPCTSRCGSCCLRSRSCWATTRRCACCCATRLDEEDLAKLSTRSRFRQALEAGSPSNTGPPGSATSYAWLYTGLDGLAPYNVFHWSLTHQNAVIDGHLATYRGIFVGDACGANARLQQRSGGRIVHASCNMHARREFIQAESNDPILASQAISFYRQLYDVEERGKTLDAAARYAVAAARGGADLEPHATLVGRRCGEAGAAPQQDRRSAGLSAEPVVGTDGVPRRSKNSDRQ